jgi:hypothetical protein
LQSKAKIQLAGQQEEEAERMNLRRHPLRAHWTRETVWLPLAAAVFGIGCAHTIERNDWEAY